MTRFQAVLTLLLALSLPGTAAAEGIEVRYLANEGFLLAAGDRKVLIDGLYGDGIPGYPAVPAEIRARAEAATGEFAGVDLVLASHFHGDHFDPAAVARHLRANPGARFVSTRQAVERLLGEAGDLADRVDGFWPPDGERETLEHAGIQVTVLRLHHGRSDAQNLGLIVDLAGVRFIHVGDTVITAGELRPLGLRQAAIDVALVPCWFFDAPRYRPGLDEFGARHLVAMHFPAPDAPARYFGGAGSLEGRIEAVRKAVPEVWLPVEPLETRSFSGR